MPQPIIDVEQLPDGTRWSVGADPYEVAERAAFCRAATYFGIRVGYDRAEKEAGDDGGERRPPPQRNAQPRQARPQQAEQKGDGPLSGQPDEFQADGLTWRKTRNGDGYSAEVTPAEFGGASRLLLKYGKDGIGAAAFHKEGGLMNDVGWHNAPDAAQAIALLTAALTEPPF